VEPGCVHRLHTIGAVISAVAFTTWLQVATALAAAAAAGASWFAVAQTRKLNREARLPELVMTASFIGAGDRPLTMGVTIVNGGGGVATQVSFVLATSEEVGRSAVAGGIMQPAEFAPFGSQMAADPDHRGVVFGRSFDGDYVWNLDGEKRSIEQGDQLPSYEAIFALFYPDVDLDRLRPVQMLRG
jgi:hypothetical protein